MTYHNPCKLADSQDALAKFDWARANTRNKSLPPTSDEIAQVDLKANRIRVRAVDNP